LLTLLYVPNVRKSVFATVDLGNTVCSYTMKEDKCVQLYTKQHNWIHELIKAIWMLREVYCDANLDFLIVWFEDGQTYINGANSGRYKYVSLRGKALICLSASKGCILEIYAKHVYVFETTLHYYNFYHYVDKEIKSHVDLAFSTRSSFLNCIQSPQL